MVLALEKLGPPRLPIAYVSGGEIAFVSLKTREPVLVLPDGIYSAPALDNEGAQGELLGYFASKRDILGEFFLLGTGSRYRLPSARFRQGIEDLNLGCEVMDTPAAARTYNILLNENRIFTAGFVIA